MATTTEEFTADMLDENFMEIFIKAMDSDRMIIVDSLIQAKNKDPSFPLDINQCTLLTAVRGNVTVLSKLLTLRPRMSYGDSENRRAIHYAAKSGHLECVRLLLKAGAISNCADVHGRTPLHLACAMGHKEIVSLLVSQCAHINTCRTEMGENAVHVTAGTSYVEVMDMLLDRGGDVNTGTRRTKGGETPLHKAVLADKPEMVDLLCSRGARMDIADAHGKPPLHVACEKGLLRCIRVLIQHGASLEAQDNWKQTPLCAALYENQTSVAKTLVEEGANVQVEDKFGFSPLHRASMKGNLELIDQLVAAGANINYRTADSGHTPLMSAVSTGKVEAIHRLLALGADVSLPDVKGHTPLHMAHFKTGGEPTERIMEAVLLGGARLDVRDEGRMTPIQRGIVVGVIRRKMTLPWLALLCQAGSPLGPDEFTMGRKSPLFWLAYSGFLEEALYLTRAGWDLSEETWVVLPGKDDRQDRLHHFMLRKFQSVPSLLACTRKVLRSYLTSIRQCREILSAIDTLPIPIPLKSFLKLYDIDPTDTSVLDPQP